MKENIRVCTVVLRPLNFVTINGKIERRTKVGEFKDVGVLVMRNQCPAWSWKFKHQC